MQPTPDPGQCLVTGATGFVGGAVARRLRADGLETRCLVRASSDRSGLAGLGVRFADGDLTDAESVRRAAAGCRFIVHCGALVSDWAGVGEIRAINVRGTANVMAAAAAESVERVVHVSTTDVYGYPGTAKVSEAHPQTGFANWYSQTKREAEAEVWKAAGDAGVEVCILRPATVYGPGSKAVVGEMARALTRGQMLMVNAGRANAGLVYVENLADAVTLALTGRGAAGETFNVTDELDVSWRRFLGDLAVGLDCPPPRWSLPYALALTLGSAIEHGYRLLHVTTGLTSGALLSRQAVQVLGRDQDFSSAKLRSVLGWEPRTSYAAGLNATLTWLKTEYLLGSG